MKALWDYLSKHTERGDCECGQCVDAPPTPTQPLGHTADLIFFKVAMKNDPAAVDFVEIIENARGNDNLDLFDGKEHGYMEIGGWIGDQGAALVLMGLGALLGVWRLLTPRTVLPMELPEELVMNMAGMGMVSIQVEHAEGG